MATTGHSRAERSLSIAGESFSRGDQNTTNRDVRMRLQANIVVRQQLVLRKRPRSPRASATRIPSVSEQPGLLPAQARQRWTPRLSIPCKSFLATGIRRLSVGTATADNVEQADAFIDAVTLGLIDSHVHITFSD